MSPSVTIGWNHMGVSKNRGTPKWMVYKGKPYLNGWFGGTTILGNPHIPFFFWGGLFTKVHQVWRCPTPNRKFRNNKLTPTEQQIREKWGNDDFHSASIKQHWHTKHTIVIHSTYTNWNYVDLLLKLHSHDMTVVVLCLWHSSEF